MISNAEREFLTEYLMRPFNVCKTERTIPHVELKKPDNRPLYVTSSGLGNSVWYDRFWDIYQLYMMNFKEDEFVEWPVTKAPSFYTFDEISETQYDVVPLISFAEVMGFSDD
jgi:hypothetical protein